MAHVVDQWTTPNPVEGAAPKKIRTDRWGKGKRLLARWDEDGRRVSKAFDNRDAAEAFVSRTHTEQVDGTYIDKAKKDVVVADVWPIWQGGRQVEVDPRRVPGGVETHRAPLGRCRVSEGHPAGDRRVAADADEPVPRREP